MLQTPQQTYYSSNTLLRLGKKIEKDKPRVPIQTNKTVRNCWTTRVMTMDLHADQIQDFLKTG
jgi:phosphoribosylpyrophosphate synthetase